jgi:hypothetical protein
MATDELPLLSVKMIGAATAFRTQQPVAPTHWRLAAVKLNALHRDLDAAYENFAARAEVTTHGAEQQSTTGKFVRVDHIWNSAAFAFPLSILPRGEIATKQSRSRDPASPHRHVIEWPDQWCQ